MELIQSYLYSVSRVALTLYEQRILVKVVEFAQKRVKGLPMSRNLRKLDHDYDNVKMVIPVKYLLGDGSQHYDYVYDAATKLMGRTFEYYDPISKTWYKSPIIYNVQVRHRSGTIVFYCARALFDAIFDFSQGYRQFDLATAMSLPNPAAVRMFALLSGQTQPITYTVDALKMMFNVQDQYKQTADFIRKVILPAQQALNDAGCDTFTFKKLNGDREIEGKGIKVTSLRLYPVRVKQQSDIAAQLTHDEITDRTNIERMLSLYAGATNRELAVEHKTITNFAKTPDCITQLHVIIKYANRPNYTKKGAKSYIFGAMKDEYRRYKSQFKT